MAFANPQITATSDCQATEFYDLARQYRVTGVPKTVVNGDIEILGALPESQFVRTALGIEDAQLTHSGDHRATCTSADMFNEQSEENRPCLLGRP